jgi:hypothetical protein
MRGPPSRSSERPQGDDERNVPYPEMVNLSLGKTGRFETATFGRDCVDTEESIRCAVPSQPRSQSTRSAEGRKG